MGWFKKKKDVKSTNNFKNNIEQKPQNEKTMNTNSKETGNKGIFLVITPEGSEVNSLNYSKVVGLLEKNPEHQLLKNSLTEMNHTEKHETMQLFMKSIFLCGLDINMKKDEDASNMSLPISILARTKYTSPSGNSYREKFDYLYKIGSLKYGYDNNILKELNYGDPSEYFKQLSVKEVEAGLQIFDITDKLLIGLKIKDEIGVFKAKSFLSQIPEIPLYLVDTFSIPL